ncbi:UNVERIFIED_CONTAM: hypothetical protein Sindi_0456000 [Sesamum indicum]
MMVMTYGDDGQRKFSKFYVCFDALRQGFLSGCRPVIGVDGCHLKGPYGGVLLTAISIDPNNNLYLAYAVVSGETREAWQWFFELLKDDSHIIRDDIYTFISDKQKGLFPAFEYVFPGADNRFYVRHLYGNMKTVGFRGLAFKKALWIAAKATIVSEFNFRMEEFAKLNPKLVEWLSDKPPTHWSRAYLIVFQTADCIPIKSDDWYYEVSCYDGARKWDLTGIPCKHGMSAICTQSLEPKDFVNPCYSVATFIEVYKNEIFPVNGPNLWEKSGLIPCLPPNFGRGAGRPARARRLEYGEPANKGKKRTRGQRNQITKMKRQPYKVKCHYCGETCHNKKGCARKKKDQSVASMQLTVIEKAPQKTSRRLTRSMFIESFYGPNLAASQSNTAGMTSEHMLHNFTQCSKVNQSSVSGVPCLTIGGKNFVTMANLSAALDATKKNKKKIAKKAK